MQAGVVNRPLIWRDIFTAHGLSAHLFGILHVITFHLSPYDAAKPLTIFWPYEQRTAA
jgi:hypothetical protein